MEAGGSDGGWKPLASCPQAFGQWWLQASGLISESLRLEPTISECQGSHRAKHPANTPNAYVPNSVYIRLHVISQYDFQLSKPGIMF
jgi:hypothetical protein